MIVWLLPLSVFAGDIVPLAISPVSVEITATPGGAAPITANGIASASIDQAFVSGDYVGQVEATVTTQSDRIAVEFSGMTVQTDPLSGFNLILDVRATIEIEVPEVGGPITPAYIDFVDFVDAGTGWSPT